MLGCRRFFPLQRGFGGGVSMNSGLCPGRFSVGIGAGLYRGRSCNKNSWDLVFPRVAKFIQGEIWRRGARRRRDELGLGSVPRTSRAAPPSCRPGEPQTLREEEISEGKQPPGPQRRNSHRFGTGTGTGLCFLLPPGRELPPAVLRSFVNPWLLTKHCEMLLWPGRLIN